MYSDVSTEYLIAINDAATRRRLLGTIDDIPFTGNDVIRNSFEVQNRCAEESEMKIGGVYIGQLNMVFVPSFLSKVPKKSYIGKVIRPYIGLYVPDTEEWEDVPLGVFTIKSAKISKDGISIEAYDNMKKLDKAWDLAGSMLSSTPYGFLKMISLECGVELGITKEEVEELPNGTEELFLVEENDIETYRDVLYWIAQTLGCFATIDREGQLVVRQFGQGTAEMTDKHRDVDAVYSDYTTKYTSITMYDLETGEDQYYALHPDDGLTMNLGSNPFLQTVSNRSLQQAIIYVETKIESIDGEISDLETQLGLIETALEEVEAALREHPDDPVLIALRNSLLSEKAVVEQNIYNKEQEKADYENELQQLQRGLINASRVFKRKAREAILKAVNEIQYAPFYVNSARDPIFELGDKIFFTGGMAQGEEGCVMALSYRVDNFCFEGYGDDPALSDSRSKTDKSVTGTRRALSKEEDKVQFAKFVNVDSITIHENEEKEIGFIRFGVNKDCEVEAWLEMKLKTDLSTVGIDGKAGIFIKYYLDGQEVAYHPVEEWQAKGNRSRIYLQNNVLHFTTQEAQATDQTHTVNYQYHLPKLSSVSAHIWRVAVVGLNGEQFIDTEDAHIVLWASSLKGDNEWIGRIEARDEIPVYEFDTLEMIGTLTDEVEVTLEGTISGLNITTENGDIIITEGGDRITTE